MIEACLVDSHKVVLAEMGDTTRPRSTNRHRTERVSCWEGTLLAPGVCVVVCATVLSAFNTFVVNTCSDDLPDPVDAQLDDPQARQAVRCALLHVVAAPPWLFTNSMCDACSLQVQLALGSCGRPLGVMHRRKQSLG